MKYVDEKIYNAIPNRKPFMILKTLEVDGDKAESTLDLNEDQWFFKCHYPSHPMVPMTLLIESMTQVFISILLNKFDKKGEIPMLYSISALRMKEQVVPGDDVKIISVLTFVKGGSQRLLQSI